MPLPHPREQPLAVGHNLLLHHRVALGRDVFLGALDRPTALLRRPMQYRPRQVRADDVERVVVGAKSRGAREISFTRARSRVANASSMTRN